MTERYNILVMCKSGSSFLWSAGNEAPRSGDWEWAQAEIASLLHIDDEYFSFIPIKAEE